MKMMLWGIKIPWRAEIEAKAAIKNKKMSKLRRGKRAKIMTRTKKMTIKALLVCNLSCRMISLTSAQIAFVLVTRQLHQPTK
jgi:hypothetical protein